MSLFQSDAWQSAWWDTWGRQYNLTPIRSWVGACSGLYLSKYFLKGVIPVRSLEFVGCNYRNVRSVRTEYNSLFSMAEDQKEQALALTRLLSETEWSEAIFSDLLEPSNDISFIYNLANTNGWLIRQAKSDMAWSVDTTGLFKDYLKSLGPNTRLRLYNRRRVLESLGEITIEDLWQQKGGLEKFFELIEGFHKARWGKPAFREKSREFHKRFLERIVLEGGQPLLTVLNCEGVAVSVIYNIKYGDRVYNLQSGFEENYHKKLSLGILHLGYAIEDAFRDPEVKVFDMLAGEGKKQNYKQHIATDHYNLVSLMVVRSELLKSLYKIKDSQFKRIVDGIGL